MTSHGRPSRGRAAFDPTSANDGGVLLGHYRLEQRLGRGSAGTVQAAVDLRTGAPVAIKTLDRWTPRGLQGLKRAFRSLQHVPSPHLVRLLELHEHEGQLYLIMERARGVPFDRAVEALNGRPDRFDRLRAMLSGIARGLDDLHRAGFVHRDLKPANVMVDEHDHPRLLDFELMDLRPAEHEDAGLTELAGTPRYMAPEQIQRRPAVPASDYYALGVMAFHALTGHHAHPGSIAEIFRRRCDPDAAVPRPCDSAPDVPEDLDALVVGLLAGDARRRAGYHDVLEVCEDGPSARRIGEPGFVGRVDERRGALTFLRAGLGDGNRGRVLRVHGPAGRGKSALLDELVTELRRHGCLTLRGRCRKSEALPYQAIDEALDGLALHRRARRETDDHDIDPGDLQQLLQLFPTLALGLRAPRPESKRPPRRDPNAGRRAVGRALERLLRGARRRGPVAIVLDDLQWLDDDGAMLLSDLLEEADALGVLWILASRPVDEVGSLWSAAAAHPLLRVDLEPLALEERRELCDRMLSSTAASQFDALLGSEERDPFSVVTLARIVGDGLDEPGRQGGRATLAELVSERRRALSPSQARLLDVLGLAYGPIDVFLARALLPPEEQGAVEHLEQHGWIRSVSRGDATVLELAHDRLREWAGLDADDAPPRQALHLELAEAFIARPDMEAFRWAIARHAFDGDALELAARHAEAAGDAFVANFAFARAIDAYDLAVQAMGESAPPRLLEKRADVHRDDGRGDLAADTYLALADRIERMPPATASKQANADPESLRLKAARALLDQGNDARGQAILAQLLSRVDVALPRSTADAMVRVLMGRRRVPRPLWEGVALTAPDPQRQQRRADACWAASIGYTLGDPAWTAYFHTLHLDAAARTGDPDRVARAVCLDLSFRAPEGEKLRTRNLELVERCRALWQDHPDPYIRGVLDIGEGLVAFHLGDFARAAASLGHAVDTLGERCRDFVKESATAQVYELCGLAMLGDLDTLDDRVERYLQPAIDRRNLFVMCMSQVGVVARGQLTRGRVDEVRAQVERALGEWMHEGRLSPHMLGRLSLFEVDLFEGRVRQAIDRMRSLHRFTRGSLLWRAQVARIYMHFGLGRAELAGVSAGVGDCSLRRASAHARALRKERREWATGLACMLEAGVLMARGKQVRASAALRAARAATARAGLGLHEAACSERLGEVLGGEAGVHMQEAARRRLARDGSRDTARAMARVLLP